MDYCVRLRLFFKINGLTQLRPFCNKHHFNNIIILPKKAYAVNTSWYWDHCALKDHLI